MPGGPKPGLGALWEAHLGRSSGPPIFTQLGGSLESDVFYLILSAE